MNWIRVSNGSKEDILWICVCPTGVYLSGSLEENNWAIGEW